MQTTSFDSFGTFAKQTHSPEPDVLTQTLIKNSSLTLQVNGCKYTVSIIDNKAVAKRLNPPKNYFFSFIEFFTHRLREFSISSRATRISHLITTHLFKIQAPQTQAQLKLYLDNASTLFNEALTLTNNPTATSADQATNALQKLVADKPEICTYETKIDEITKAILDAEQQKKPIKGQDQYTANTNTLRAQYEDLLTAENQFSQLPECLNQHGIYMFSGDHLSRLTAICNTLKQRAELLKDRLTLQLQTPVGSAEILQAFLDPKPSPSKS